MKMSLEEAARELRYEKLEICARENGYDYIATAHNLYDNTETTFLNLIKGAGLNGMSGIPVKRSNIIRPVLCLTKPEIIFYLQRERLEWVEDSSNQDVSFERNYLRNNIIGGIRKDLNPALDEAVFNMNSILQRHLLFIEDYLEKQVNTLWKPEDNKIYLSSELFNYDKLISGELLRRIFYKNSLNYNINTYKKLISLAGKQTGKIAEIGRGLAARRDRGYVIIEKKELSLKDILKIFLGKSARSGNYEIGIDKGSPEKQYSEPDCVSEYIDAADSAPFYVLRIWEPGDKFIPLGMRGFKKVSDFLTDAKISGSRRKNQLVLLNRNNIVWIVGLRIDERFKVKESTKETHRLWIKHI